MAAVFALVFIPVVASIGFMLGANVGVSLPATIAMLMFAVLAMGVFLSVFKMARRWEDETL
ncbi:MAG: hypothetical protein KF773_17380 [Deltaproteobacteria bacterium]|nr:hypothetical protein [Deltaproteobacteria bacterium]MCW5803104.1 hypothetical protein [Deltaproteobacteria bacterium]